MPTNRIIGAIVGIVAILGLAANAAAEDYPSQPITMIVPFAAGGSSAHHVWRHESFTWKEHCHRKCRRRGRQRRRRRVAQAPRGRLHAPARPVEHERHQRRGLRSPLRSAEGLRADRTVAEQPDACR